MNLEFVNKIVKVFFKILELIKIKKRNKKMAGNNEQQPVAIGANTVIQFTIKGFISTIVSILGIFASFYFIVFEPRVEKAEEYQKELYEEQKQYIEDKFDNVNSSIKKNGQNMEDLSNRFNDLNNTFDEIANSGGSFGSNTTSASPAVGDNGITLASNDGD
jgi:hypothetical protein